LEDRGIGPLTVGLQDRLASPWNMLPHSYWIAKTLRQRRFNA